MSTEQQQVHEANNLRAIGDGLPIPNSRLLQSNVARIGGEVNYIHLLPGVTGTGASAGNRRVWDGTGIVPGVVNILLGRYWTLTGTARLVATHTELVGHGTVQVIYSGTGNAIHVHNLNDSATPEDDANVTWHQRVANLWIHANGSASGSAVAGNAIDVDQSHNATLGNVRISGRWTRGIYVGNTTNCYIVEPKIAGSDPSQYDWTLADSPDYGIVFGKRTGNSFGPQNTVIVNPWVRFEKIHAIYFENDAAAFGVNLHGGQIGDTGQEVLASGNLNSAQGFHVLGTDMETTTSTVLDTDGNQVTINWHGRECLFMGVHTLGAVLLNDSRNCHYLLGEATKVWLGSSDGSEVLDPFLIGTNGRLWDAGTATNYHVRCRPDLGQNAATGAGEFSTRAKSQAADVTFNGGVKVMAFPGHTSWIDFPGTGGASGIGDGGAGANLWLGRANANGQFFPDAAAGDILSRAPSGKSIRWGDAASSNSTMFLNASSLTLRVPFAPATVNTGTSPAANGLLGVDASGNLVFSKGGAWKTATLT
jgi:hypothetical protein